MFDGVVDLIIRFKQENPRWGYKKIRDQVVCLGYKIIFSVKNILSKNGYDPEPELNAQSTWHEFTRSHRDVLAACDFLQSSFLRTIDLSVVHFFRDRAFYM